MGNQLMLSRIAENLFWMGRMVERAEGTARALSVQFSSTLEEEGPQTTWEPILNAVGQLNGFFEFHTEASRENVIDYLVFNPENENSVVECIHQARENARGVRDMISQETWEILNITYHEIYNFDREKLQNDTTDKFFHFIRERSHLFHGVTASTMFRGTGYFFLNAGKYIERADQTARILDVKYHIPLKRIEDVGNPVDIYQWKSLLDSVGAYEAYLKVYGTRILPIQIAELLIFNQKIPRSLLFCIERALQSVKSISMEKEKYYANKAEQKLGKLHYQIAYASIEEIFFFGLHEYLTNIINDLIAVGNQMSYTYFGHQL